VYIDGLGFAERLAIGHCITPYRAKRGLMG